MSQRFNVHVKGDRVILAFSDRPVGMDGADCEERYNAAVAMGKL